MHHCAGCGAIVRQWPTSPGNRYFRTRRGNVTETATVVDLREDIVRIPHVHFLLAFEEAAIGHIDAGNRVLALPSFVATYHQRA